MRLGVVLIGSFLFSVSGFGQQTWTMQKCIEYALQHNSGFLSESLETQRTANSITRAKGNYLPSVNGNAEHFYNTGKQWNYASESYEQENFQSGSLGIGAEVDIFKGFRNKYDLQIQKFLHDMQVSNVEASRNMLALSVAQAYMQNLYSMEYVASAENQIAITQAELDKVKAQVESGIKTKADLLRLRAQMESERSELVYQEGQSVIAKLKLMQLMEFTPDSVQTVENFTINTQIPDAELPVLVTADSIYEAAKQLPEIAAAQYRLESAREQVAFSKSMYSPELKAQASYGTSYSSLADNSIGNQIGNNHGASIGVKLSIPIFNKYQTKTAVANSKIDYLQAEKNIVETEKSIRFQVENAYQDALTAKKRYDVENQSVAFYEESFRFAQAQLDAGTITALDFNTEKTALAAAQTKLIKARYELLYYTLMLNYFTTGTVNL